MPPISGYSAVVRRYQYSRLLL